MSIKNLINSFSDIHLELLEINESNESNNSAVFTKGYFVDSFIQNRKTLKIEPYEKLRLLYDFDKRHQNVEILN